MTKEEIIQQAWGECYNSVFWSKRFDKNTGWMEYGGDSPRLKTIDGKTTIIGFEDIEIDVDGYDTPQFGYVTKCFRPKSLRGIETNNGWTKVENKSDLPKVSGTIYKVVLKDGSIEETDINYSLREVYNIWKITHYKRVKKDLPPLY